MVYKFDSKFWWKYQFWVPLSTKKVVLLHICLSLCVVYMYVYMQRWRGNLLIDFEYTHNICDVQAKIDAQQIIF